MHSFSSFATDMYLLNLPEGVVHISCSMSDVTCRATDNFEALLVTNAAVPVGASPAIGRGGPGSLHLLTRKLSAKLML